MFNFLKRWRPATLFASWVVYWILLVLATLTPAIAAIWKATHAVAGQGNVSLNFSNWFFQLLVSVRGQNIYTGSAHFLTIALLVGGPPLVLWALWLSQRQRMPKEPMSF